MYSLLGYGRIKLWKNKHQFCSKNLEWKYRRVLTSEVILECSKLCRGFVWRWGTRWLIWLRYRATSRKVIEIFHWRNPSVRTMSQESTQPRTEMRTRNVYSGGEGNWCALLTNLPPSCADCLKIWEPQPPGTLRVCPSLYKDCFTFTSVYENYSEKSSLLKCTRLEVSSFYKVCFVIKGIP